MFEVRFATKEEGVGSVAWEPKAGDGYSCRKREAMRRWEHLLIEGREGRTVDGVIPHIVEIVDRDGKVMLTCTTADGDQPSGPWAVAKAA